MEKKSVKLLELFNVGDDRYQELSGLTVVKVDIYKAKASINIILEGVETIKDNKSLVSLVEELEHDFGTKVNFTFKDVNSGNFLSLYNNIRVLVNHYIARDSEGGISDLADFISLNFGEDYSTVNIEIPSGWAMMLSDADRKALISAVDNAIHICVSDVISFHYEIVTSDPDIAGSDVAPEDDILKAIEEGRLEFPEDEPVEEQGKKGTKKKKAEDDKASDAKPAGKDSWTAKAEQVRKEAKQEDK